MHRIKSSLVLIATVLTVIFSSHTAFSQDAKKIFKANCASCHKPTEEAGVGPGLKGLKSRWPDQAKLISWVKNSTAYLATGDVYANELKKKYNNGVMPAQALSDAEIIAVTDWADKGGDGPVVTTTPPPPGADVVEPANDTPQYVLMGLGILLLLLVIVLGTVRRSLQSLVNDQRGVETPERPSRPYVRFKIWASKNKKLVAIIGLFLICWFTKLGWDGLLGIGVHQGYAPEQPIRFSHKLHAGDNKISCVYCHTGVGKSKHANIPSANVCMNCHMAINEGPVYGKAEIQKIYTAVDWDPQKRTYGTNTKPVEWIRVHSLPDLAYFNHSQHVTVGKIECKQCHGAVDSMEVVKQNSPLTMGWCIDCHRQTEVDFKENKYYEELHKEFLADPKHKKGDKFTIGKLGGLECSKCHY